MNLHYVDLVLSMAKGLHPYHPKEYDQQTVKTRAHLAAELDERQVTLAFDTVTERPFTIRRSVSVLAQSPDGAWYLEYARTHEKEDGETHLVQKLRPHTFSETRKRGESVPEAVLRAKREEPKLPDEVGILQPLGLIEKIEEGDSSVYLGVYSVRLTVTVGLLVPIGLWKDEDSFEDTEGTRIHIRRYTEWPFPDPPPFQVLV